jgi:hypothetical protein
MLKSLSAIIFLGIGVVLAINVIGNMTMTDDDRLRSARDRLAAAEKVVDQDQTTIASLQKDIAAATDPRVINALSTEQAAKQLWEACNARRDSARWAYNTTFHANIQAGSADEDNLIYSTICPAYLAMPRQDSAIKANLLKLHNEDADGLRDQLTRAKAQLASDQQNAKRLAAEVDSLTAKIKAQ